MDDPPGAIAKVVYFAPGLRGLIVLQVLSVVLLIGCVGVHRRILDIVVETLVLVFNGAI
jgi:hypothetical protein